MNKKVYSLVVKKALTGFVMIFLFGCNNFPNLDSTPSTANIDEPAGQTSLSTASPISSTSVVSEVCPVLKPVKKGLPIKGSLIYWDYPLNYLLSFPDLSKIEIEPSSANGSTSPNGEYFSTTDTLYDQDGNFKGHFLYVLDTAGKIIASDPWQNEWTDSPVWLNNDELLLSYQNGSVLIYNPLSKSTRYHSINLPDNQNIEVRTIDPSFRTVIFSYLDPNFVIYRFDTNATRIWDLKNQKDIIVLRDKYDDLVYGIELSQDKNKTAITLSSPNEEKIHSEIIIIDNTDSTYIWQSDFRSIFDEIHILDIKWSFNDRDIYFWGMTNPDTVNLFSINIQSKQVKKYCFLGKSQLNTITWVNNMPGFYFVNDSRNYIKQDDSETWDVLLVDSKNNTAYVVAKNILPLGWLNSR